MVLLRLSQNQEFDDGQAHFQPVPYGETAGAVTFEPREKVMASRRGTHLGGSSGSGPAARPLTLDRFPR